MKENEIYYEYLNCLDLDWKHGITFQFGIKVGSLPGRVFPISVRVTITSSCIEKSKRNRKSSFRSGIIKNRIENQTFYQFQFTRKAEDFIFYFVSIIMEKKHWKMGMTHII